MYSLLTQYACVRPMCVKWSGEAAETAKADHEASVTSLWDRAATELAELSGKPGLTRNDMLVEDNANGKLEVVGFSAVSGLVVPGFSQMPAVRFHSDEAGRVGYAPCGRTTVGRAAQARLAAFNKDKAPYARLWMYAAEVLGLHPIQAYDVGGRGVISYVYGFWDTEQQAIWLYVPCPSDAFGFSHNREQILQDARLERVTLDSFADRAVELGHVL